MSTNKKSEKNLIRITRKVLVLFQDWRTRGPQPLSNKIQSSQMYAFSTYLAVLV